MMNTTAKIFTLLSLSLLISCKPQSETPSQADCPPEAKESDAILFSTLWLQNAPEATIARKQAYQWAEKQMAENLQRYSKSKKPWAVVLDLDETVLDNSPYEARLIQEGGSFSPETWDAWVAEANADLLPGAADFLNKAAEMGLAVFYISNRDQAGLGATIKNMARYQLPFADSAHVLLKTDSSDKTARRLKVEENHKIILLLGDQMGDFAEAEQLEAMPADSLNNHFVLIPNPMYGAFTKLSEEEKAAHSNKLAAWKQNLKTKK